MLYLKKINENPTIAGNSPLSESPNMPTNETRGIINISDDEQDKERAGNLAISRVLSLFEKEV